MATNLLRNTIDHDGSALNVDVNSRGEAQFVKILLSVPTIHIRVYSHSLTNGRGRPIHKPETTSVGAQFISSCPKAQEITFASIFVSISSFVAFH